MFVVRILGWDLDRAWVGWSDYHRKYLEAWLEKLSELEKATIKCLARQIRDRKSCEIPLTKAEDPFAVDSFGSFLASLGAEVVVVEM